MPLVKHNNRWVYTPKQGVTKHSIKVGDKTYTFNSAQEVQEWLDTNTKSNRVTNEEFLSSNYKPKQNSISTRRGINMFIGANYSPSFNKHFYGTSDFDALFGKSKVEGVMKAWERNPQVMQNWTDGGNLAAAMISAPFAAYAAGEYALPWLAENVAPYLSARGWLEATQAVGNTSAWLTPTSATAIDAILAGSATGASINDMRENGPTTGNVLGTALGVAGLAYEAIPTVTEGYPTIGDFRLIEDHYGLNSGVIPMSEYLQNTLPDAIKNMLQDPTQIRSWSYPNGREVQLIPGGTYLDRSLQEESLINKAPYRNVFYDPASHVEANSGVTNRRSK